MLRRTKIIATVGPSCLGKDIIIKMILSGVNLFRINMSHGDILGHRKSIQLIRSVACELNKEIGIVVDLQGPKIRISCFKNNYINLKQNDIFILDAKLDPKLGNQNKVGIEYKELVNEVKAKDILFLNDGKISLEVIDIQDQEIKCLVKVGGELSNNKGINFPEGNLSLESLTTKDKKDLFFAIEQQVGYIALSFVRKAENVINLRKILNQNNCNAGIISKIECTQALENLDEIIKESDAVMVARGDLGVEIGYVELPAVQKKIIKKARSMDKAVITATQMMESMINSPVPTRAEVSDVANAVLDGTDAVMLSAETASGSYPDKVVCVMSQICFAAEKQKENLISHHKLEENFTRADYTIAMCAMYSANHFKVKAIISFTESGSTTLWMSRIRSGIPIYGISRNKEAVGKMTLYRGVYPILFDISKYENWDEIYKKIISILLSNNFVNKEDNIIITKGDILHTSGNTDSMKIVKV